MRLFARFHPYLLLFVFVWGTALPACAEQPAVSFSWALLTDSGDGRRALDTTVPISLASGDTLQFYFDCQTGAYIYLFLEDVPGELSLLYPETPDFYATNPPRPRKFRVPPSPERFRLVPPPGQERIHLLVSATRLTDLEKLTAVYVAAPEDKQLQAAVIQELKRLRRRHSQLAQPPEASIPVAGTIRTRGTEPEARRFTVLQVTDAVFYSRAIRLNHE